MRRSHTACGCALCFALACGGQSGADTEGRAVDGSGGTEPATTSSGATFSTGGAPNPETGGASALGGSSANAGAPAVGGEPTTGGAPSTGGLVPTGGSVGASGGGSPDTGGAPSAGGVGTAGTEGISGGGSGVGGAETTGGAAGTAGTPGGLPRFVGNTTTRYRATPAGLEFADYWDQMTVENAGQWPAVQPSVSGAFNWSTLDAIYDYTEAHGILFKEQAFVAGFAQPSGVTSEADVIQWIRSFCERYPNTALIDVVTEPPPHSQPNFVDVMGGGTNGDWQWITNAFLWAREHCPGAVLILSDYNNIEWPTENERFIELVNVVLDHGAPIDAVGAEAHDIDQEGVTPEIVAELLQKLHQSTGLPVYVTEMDIGLLDDQEQLAAYQQYFPLFRDADFVPGITIWGWIDGATWREATGLVREGEPRPAMTWLMNELGRPVP